MNAKKARKLAEKVRNKPTPTTPLENILKMIRKDAKRGATETNLDIYLTENPVWQKLAKKGFLVKHMTRTGNTVSPPNIVEEDNYQLTTISW